MSRAPQTKTASQFRCPNRVVPPANINGAIAPTSKLANGVLMPKSRADKSEQSTPIFMKEHSFWGTEIAGLPYCDYRLIKFFNERVLDACE